jgi:hypothetical protein
MYGRVRMTGPSGTCRTGQNENRERQAKLKGWIKQARQYS